MKVGFFLKKCCMNGCHLVRQIVSVNMHYYQTNTIVYSTIVVFPYFKLDSELLLSSLLYNHFLDPVSNKNLQDS